MHRCPFFEPSQPSTEARAVCGQAAEASVSPRQATIVHRLVSRAIDAAIPRKARCNRLSVAFPPVERPEPKTQVLHLCSCSVLSDLVVLRTGTK